MNKAISSLVLGAGILLAGCGGSGDDSSSSGNSGPTTVTITAIDGYLGSAEVYSDENLNSVADSDEYLGDTAENGQLSVPVDVLNYPIIVKVVAGKTTDSDIAGVLTENRQIIAAAGGKYITPFTTLAALQQVSLAELAEELGLELDAINGDFIAGHHGHIHAIARAVMALFQAELANTVLDIAALMQKANSLALYVTNNPKDDWSDVNLVISDNGVVSEAGDENVPSTQFDYTKASFIWETKDFSEHTYDDGETFHPCDMQWLNDETILVGNCFGNYFLTLSGSDGSIINSLDLTGSDAWGSYKRWFVHGDVLHIINYYDSSDQTFYNSELKPITAEQANLSIKTAISPDGRDFLDLTEDGAMTTLMDKASVGTNTVETTWIGDGVTYRYYDWPTGVVSEIGSDGIVKEKQLAIPVDIIAAVADIHNNSEFGDESPMYKLNFTLNGTDVKYLTDDTFLVTHTSYQSETLEYYHYFYINGKVVYLGLFESSSWYTGADNSTVSAYSSMRMGFDNTDPHIFRQYRISDGELIGNHEFSYDLMNGILYGQVHTAKGIVSNSDSYSSVSLLR